MGAVLAYCILDFFRLKNNNFFAYYLMHYYAYSARAKGACAPELETRMGEFVDRINEPLRSDVDEVLVVSHCSGVHIGVSVIADLLRVGRLPADGPTLSFLTLGQVVPMVPFLRDAWRLRANLTYLSQQYSVLG